MLTIVKSIEHLAENVLKDALASGASDIHIVPRDKDTLIKFRLGNRLLPRYTLDQNDCDRLISHFKFTASMDIGEKRRPQSGAYTYQYEKTKIGLRISTLPANKSESMVIRLLPQQDQIPSYQISLFPSTTRKLNSLLLHAHGLIIFTGPTGSGKTTTLYSMLSETSETINRNVITLEDPIEKPNDAMLQVQVNERAGISYSAGLKAILRHDPDIILVGEIRDKETAEIAVRAALTGHLVLTTMHTRDAKGAVYRLLEFDINMLEIEQTLLAVTAQRLVELTCPYCDDGCSPFCFSTGSGKRGTVFEILSGGDLSAVLQEARGTRQAFHYKTLKDAISKGIALGFIKASEYQRWVLNDGE